MVDWQVGPCMLVYGSVHGIVHGYVLVVVYLDLVRLYLGVGGGLGGDGDEVVTVVLSCTDPCTNMQGPACPSTKTQIPPHLICRHRDYMILLLHF